MREIQNGKKVFGSLQYQPQVKILRERKEKKNPLMSYSVFTSYKVSLELTTQVLPRSASTEAGAGAGSLNPTLGQD